MLNVPLTYMREQHNMMAPLRLTSLCNYYYGSIQVKDFIQIRLYLVTKVHNNFKENICTIKVWCCISHSMCGSLFINVIV